MSHTTQRSTHSSSLSHRVAALQVDAVACRLASETVRVLLPLAKVSAVVLSRELWRSAGYSSLHDLARERLERNSRWVREHAALHHAIERLPALRSATTGEDGGAPLGLCRALTVARVATKESLSDWVSCARQLTVSALQRFVRGRADGAPVVLEFGADCAGDFPAMAPRSAGNEAISVGATCESQVDAQHGALPIAEVGEVARVSWSIPAPLAVHAAFESALDLYRRLEGGDATVTSFVEALVAEEYASGYPPDVLQPMFSPTDLAEQNLDDRPRPELPALSVAREMLATLDEMTVRAGVGPDREVLHQLDVLSAAADLIERNLAALLVEMSGQGVLRELGFESIGAYGENRLGQGRTTIENRVRVARSLRKRPLLQRAYVTGAIGLEKGLLAIQILGPGYVSAAREAEWVAHLKQCTVKRLRDEKRALLWASAIEGRCEAPAPMSDQAWYASLRCAPGDTVAAVRRAGNAACDEAASPPPVGSVLRLRLPVDLANDLSACVEARCRSLDAAASANEESQPATDTCAAAWRVARTFSAASRCLPAWVGLLALLEEFCVSHDIAPARSASRSEVFVRSGHRCEAPGCSSRRVEWHHRHYRSRGGSDDHTNGDALCPTHHRHGEHGGYLRVTGGTPLQRAWRVGPVDDGVWYRNERCVDRRGDRRERHQNSVR
ncbi:MAG: HNH endonuclease signature motif containing protein [Acidobacteriota bacterium]